MSAEETSTFQKSLRVLREPLYARFIAAEFVSMIGSWMQTQAQQFVVEEKAAHSWEQAAISAVTMLIIPLLGPWAGTLADRADKRRILMFVLAVQALLALLVGCWIQQGVLTFWHLLPVAVALGAAAAFEIPAYSALLPELVPREKLAAAVAVDRSTFHAARIVGPALAGLIAGWLGMQAAFFANALSFLGPLAVLMTIPPRPPGTAEEEARRRTGFADGLRHVWRDLPTRRMVAIMSANTFFCSPFVIVLLTWYARRTLHLPESSVGWLMSITGIGALLASFALLAITPAQRLLFLRAGAILSVLAMLGLAAVSSFAAAALCTAVLTLGLNFLFGIGNQLIQERAPDAIRGRVSTVASLSFVGVIPVSGFVASGLEHWLGMRTTLIVCAAAYAVFAAALLARRWPREAGKAHAETAVACPAE